MDATKRICVVGAGASGLPAIRHALLYGYEVICYEGQDNIGGLWRYKPEETEESSVTKSTVINSSKEMTAYSDFPPRTEDANYMHHTKMLRYLEEYASHYNLTEHIRFKHKVLNIERSTDYDDTGRWNVSVRNLETDAISESSFGGHHTIPYKPDPWPGQDEFKGKIMHAHSYKDWRGYEDKNVVVVGVGNSAADISVELSRCAKQVYMVSRRGTWVKNRVFNYGRPSDASRDTRLVTFLRSMTPDWFAESMAQWTLNHRFDHEMYGLKPTHAISSAHPTVNDELPNRIICGSIQIVKEIESFTENGIRFVDGMHIEDVDAESDNRAELYKFIFPQGLEHDTLGMIGLIQSSGSVGPVSEMQARLVFDVLQGSTKLPSQSERSTDIEKKAAAMATRFVPSRRHTIQIDHMSYVDELSEMIGASPPSWYEVVFTDPFLSLHCIVSPVTAYFYRLRGPHPWEGARDAILTIEDRIVKGTNLSNKGTLWTIRHVPVMDLLFFFVVFIIGLCFVLLLKVL